MKVKETIEEMRSYREPMIVKERFVYYSCSCEEYSIFPICPRCGAIFEIEYIKYCSSCGQRLKWQGYSKAKIRYAGEKRR